MVRWRAECSAPGRSIARWKDLETDTTSDSDNSQAGVVAHLAVVVDPTCLV
jgi:hypothetical protein